VHQNLRDQALALSIDLSHDETLAFEELARLLLIWNQKMNLTAITDPEEIVTKHFVDSLSLLRFIPRGAPLKLIDVGTGAGFPGLPLAIVSPNLSVTLLDSVGKRFLFIEEAVRALGLTRVTRLQSRAEDAGKDPAHREQYDAAVSRAVAPMRILSEYCLPLLRAGGFFYAMKGLHAEEELAEAGGLIERLGGCVQSIEELTLAGGYQRAVVIIRKIKETPKEYPRRPPRLKFNS
jgi:16S rRNA (guanine527-N7)-methyltransferase